MKNAKRQNGAGTPVEGLRSEGVGAPRNPENGHWEAEQG